MLDFLFNIPDDDMEVWDIETYPNVFTATFIHEKLDQEWYFEVSPWRNDLQALCNFIDRLVYQRIAGVGFNSLHFDYPVLHFIYKNRGACLTAADIYTKAMQIINAPWGDRFAHVIWDRDQVFPQVDLFKVHHFDNIAKSTSLKVLEFNMRSESIEDLPFPVGTMLTQEQMPVLRQYNRWDVLETRKFLNYSRGHLKMRAALSTKFGEDMTNCSDVKIGEKILIHALEQKGVQCFTYVDNKRKKLQTERDRIDIGQVIFPYVKFERYEFQQIHAELASKVITETKGIFKEMVAAVDGLEYKFGTGGLHASVKSQIIESSDTHQIVDVDVASYYPNLGIKNKLYPAHLGEEFCHAYHDVYLTRKQYDKGTAENEAYKLALNGAYGNSNNDYSPLKDSQYTMSITINGQLLLCMLVEQLVKVPGLTMIQANTDGVTYLCPREYLDHTRAVAKWWEQLTCLELEEALYTKMCIRDVNSYLAVKQDGKVKRIGAYAYETALENPGTRELPWHKDWSFRIVAKAAEACLVHGADIREFIEGHPDIYDFMGRTKVPRGSTLEWGRQPVENIVRYYISLTGKKLEKVMPPAGDDGQYKRASKVPDSLFNEVMREIGPGVWDERIHTKNKSKYEERRIGIRTGWNVRLCNNMSMVRDSVDFFDDVNYEYYIKEAEALAALMETSYESGDL